MRHFLAAALAALALSASPARAADSYVVAKLGYLWPSGDVILASGNLGQVDPHFYWEAGLGLDASFLGLELTAGSFKTQVDVLQLSISTIPLLLALQLRIPIPVVTPYVEIGGGAFFNSAEIPGLLSKSSVTWGFLAGGGVDFRFSWLLVGVEARYLTGDAGVSGLTYQVGGATLTGKVGFYL